MKHIHTIVLLFIVGLAVLVRLYKITGPVGDWHSWRQSDTAAVARNFEKFGFDPLLPRFDDLSNIPSGKDNPMGWRMVEFPLYQSVAFGIHRVLPSVSMEIVLRLVTIAASVGTLVLMYLLMASSVGYLAALMGALTYAILPYSIYFGRVILPEPFMMFWAVLSVYLLYQGDKGDLGDRGEVRVWGIIVLAGVAGAFALLVKPFAIFLLLPIPYLFFRRFGFSFYLIIGLLVYWIIGLLPLVWWRQWILQYPEGIPVYAWLFNEGNIRFKGAWFYWLFAKRIGELMLGYWGLLPFGLGMLLAPSKKEGWVFRLWATGALLYFIVIARGNVQHDYYQILLIPVLCVYVGKGLAFLIESGMSNHESGKIFSRIPSLIVFVFSFLLMVAFSWYSIRTYYWINRPEIVEAGREADRILPPNAKVIASYNGDTTFLYQTNRQGWPLGFEIDKKITSGATHYVTVSPSDNDGETKALASRFTVLIRNDRYAIIDLTKPRIANSK
ncbi:phospholipid carrier-dependent glycosyltransferase [Candidatus Gottesmanbacteria bacterium]|nr:phospholipid carrier-dependent glycosyltransferase [Candidatus Gottesmanbacteria bacterium]